MEDGVALPEDVLIEILVHLPIQSLVRFRCVSKYWCRLIKSLDFVSRHLKRDCNESLLLFRKLPEPPQGTEGGGGRQVLSFHDPDSLDSLVSPNLSLPPFLDNLLDGVFYDYMGTCNGLVCIALPEIVILCNPALHEFELLPPSPFGCPEGYHTSSVVTGFGYDAITDAYKVVLLSEIVDLEKGYPQAYEDPSVRIDLYNSSTNSWKLIDAAVAPVIIYPGPNLLFNGACHWHSSRSLSILSFDLSTEVFQHFEFPHFEDEKLAILGILNQCLALVRYGEGLVDPQRRADEQLVDIWVMKEYGVKESWTKEFVIGPYALGYPVLLLKNEWLLVVTMDYLLASCALHGTEIKRSHLLGKDGSMLAVIFKESLVSLKQVLHGKT